MKKQREGEMIFKMEGHEDGINCLAISADESVLVSGSEDCTARVWTIEAPEEGVDDEDLDKIFDADEENNREKSAKSRAESAKTEKSRAESAKSEKSRAESATKSEKSRAASALSSKSTTSKSDNDRCIGVLK